MFLIKGLLALVLSAFFAAAGMAFNPSFSSVCAFLIVAIIIPLPFWNGLMKKCFGYARPAAVILLIILAISNLPELPTPPSTDSTDPTDSTISTDSTNSTDSTTKTTPVESKINYYFMTVDSSSLEATADASIQWGDSCLVVFPNGTTMLIDAGTKEFYPSIKARLKGLRIKELDYVVFTHPQDDHTGGMWAGLFTDFTVGQVYHNGQKNPQWSESKELSQIEELCAELGIPCEVLGAGDEKIFDGVSMEVLWPTKEAIDTLGQLESDVARRNLSLVMRFDYGAHSSLFTGDLYKTFNGLNDENGEWIPGQLGAEAQLVQLYKEGELDVDLLKLPNHGTPITSNSAELFAATTPVIAVATGFTPVGDYLDQYKIRGYSNSIYFDRLHGYVHLGITNDGSIDANPERTEYLEDLYQDSSQEPAHTHTFTAATCTVPMTCSCGVTEGTPLDHDWKDATYSAAKTCQSCGLTEGEPKEVPGKANYQGHVYTGGDYSEKYHYEANCPGKNSHEITWEDVDQMRLEPCGTCVLK